MRILYPVLTLTFFFIFSQNLLAQKGGKKNVKTPPTVAPANIRAMEEAEKKRRDNPSPVAAERVAEAGNKLAKLPTTSNAEYLKKLQGNLSEDDGQNLLKTIIIIPSALNEPGQEEAFLSLKALAENERSASNFVTNQKGERIAFIICSMESFNRWMESKPEQLLAYVYEGPDAIIEAKDPFSKKKVEEGLHKIIKEKIPKRLVPGQITPTRVTPVADKPEGISTP